MSKEIQCLIPGTVEYVWEKGKLKIIRQVAKEIGIDQLSYLLLKEAVAYHISMYAEVAGGDENLSPKEVYLYFPATDDSATYIYIISDEGVFTFERKK